MLNLFISVLENPSDEENFTKIYYEYEKLVLKVTYKILEDQHYAEDASQEAWMRIAKSFSRIDSTNSQMLKGYIIKAAKNSAYSVLKKNEKYAGLELKDYYEIESNIDEEIASNEEYTIIRDAIFSLSELYRDVLTLHLINGLRAAEIARLINCSSSTVRSIIRRGKKIIARKLERIGIDG